MPDFYMTDDNLIDVREISTETLVRMAIEIQGGLQFGDVRSKIPVDEAHQAAWNGISQEIGKLTAAGYALDLPFEIPELD
jgi:hypothetical protein